MLVKDLFEARRKPRGGSGSTTHSIDMASDDDSIEIEVKFDFDVEPPEYEDGYKVHGESITLEDTKVEPFTFEKKRYTEITPEIVGYLDFPPKFEKLPGNKALIARAQDEDKKHPLTKKECDDLVNEYLSFVFDNYVEVDTDLDDEY